MTDFYQYLKNVGIEFDVLNLGGGFGIYYAEGDEKKSCNEYADYIKNIATRKRHKLRGDSCTYVRAHNHANGLQNT